MFRAVRWLNLRRLRSHPLRLVLAVVCVAAGVSLGVSVVVLTSSVSSSLRSFGNRLAGPAPLRVVGATSRGGLMESVVNVVQATPGVSGAVPVVEAVTLSDGDRGRSVTTLVLGVDCRIQALAGNFGCSQPALAAFDNQGRVLISSTLAERLGPNATIRTDLGSSPVVAAPPHSPLDSFNHGNVALLGLPLAQRLFDRPHGLDAIYVLPARGVNLADLSQTLKRNVGNWNGVLKANDPPPGVSVASSSFLPIFTLLGLFALGVGAVLVFNILSLSAEERRTELAIVAALGGTTQTVIGGAMTEGAVIGLAGGLLGCLGGFLLAHPLTDSLSSFTRPYVGVAIGVHMTLGAFVIGCAIGAAVGAIAALMAARRSVRIDVAAELSMRERRNESETRPNLTRGMLFLVVSGLGLLICWIAQRQGALQPWQASVAPIGVLIAIVGYLVASGSFAAVVARFGAGLLRRWNGTLSLGAANLARDPRRCGVMAVAVGAAVATAFVISSTHQAADQAITHGLTTGHAQEVAVSTVGTNNTFNLDAKPPPSLVAELSKVPGTASIDRAFFELSGHNADDLVGVSAYDHPWLNAPLILGTRSLGAFQGGQVLVGPALARKRHLRPGSNLVLDTPTGLASVIVGGVWEDGNVNGNTVTVPLWLFQRLYGDQPPQSVGLIPIAGVTPVQLAQNVREAHLASDLIVDTPHQLARSISKGVGQQLTAFDSIQRSLTIVAFVAVLSTMLLVGVQRRRELGLFAAVGMEPNQLASMTLAEGAGAGLIGIALSVGGAVISAIGFYWILPIIIGFKDPLIFDFATLVIWGPIALLLVTVASLLPAWRNAHVPVVEALHYE
ncbi:MAG TPA: ABC transporter permease [Acidimicrobiales bacterium]